MRYLSEIARIKSDDATQTARDKITKARRTISAATKAYKTAKSGVGSKRRGSPARLRAAKYLRDALNARRTVKKNVTKAVEPKTEEI
jgi:hypothetical protein